MFRVPGDLKRLIRDERMNGMWRKSQVSKPSAEAILPGDANGIVFAARAGMPALTRIQL
jgi:hypothetical protein